jgi:hypothetical protein
MLPGPFLFLSVALGLFLMWPLGLIFDFFGLPMFHLWGLAHGSFVIAWPALSLISYAAIWVATRQSKWARMESTDA